MTELPIECYQVKQIRQLEKMAIEKGGCSEQTLMERAGLAAFQAVQFIYPEAQNIIIFCGKGNNGGDGYIVASLAQKAGLNVAVYSLGKPQSKTAAHAYQQCEESDVKIIPFPSSEKPDLSNADLIIDAILGIGIKGDVRGDALAAIQQINAAECAVFAIDAPSGLDVDTGSILGAAVKATTTITFIGVKQGMLTGDGIDYCGELLCDELDLEDAFFEAVPASAYNLNWSDIQALLEPRQLNVHKGDFGHVLVVGGDYGMAGAARMAAEAAARVGAGLVTVATRPEHVSTILVGRPELMCHGITEIEQLLPLLKRATIVIIGPGLGASHWSESLWQTVINCDLPMIIDASALDYLAAKPQQRTHWIITPHPGEAAKLLASDSKTVQANRFQAVKALQKKYGGVSILKGAGTLIRAADPETDICTAGNPGMATAGMGDVLSGIIGGLLAQGFTLHEAAQLGVSLHATAGDLAAEEGERGLLASDVIAQLRGLVG